jgi:hypothetical protein
MSTTNILINSSNVVTNSNNSKYEYYFPTPKTMNNGSIALHSLQMYYSWFNINATLYNNHKFKYKWWNSNGDLVDTFTVTIPDGFYTITTLNLFFQSVLLKNLHYLYDTISKQNIFFLEFVENSTYYSIQLNTVPMYKSGSVPVDITKAGTWNYPTNKETPVVSILSTGNFKDLIGFNSGSYPETLKSSLYQKLSDYTPQLSPVSSVIVRCNLVSNDSAIPNDVLYSFSSGSTVWGGIIDVKPNSIYFNHIPSGMYSKLTLTFYDQNHRNIHIKDSQLLMTLLIRDE